MEQRALGRSGVTVSHVALGCGNFGGIGSAPRLFGQGTRREEAVRILDVAWEMGVTTLDTADAYGGGRSEEVIGAWLASKGPAVRDRVVVTTKTFNPMEEGADRGLSATRIRRQAQTSVRRLGLEPDAPVRGVAVTQAGDPARSISVAAACPAGPRAPERAR